MKRQIKLIFVSILGAASVLSLASCGEGTKVSNVSFDHDYEQVWKAGAIDFSKLSFIVTYENGNSEKVPVEASMIEKKDLYKFYEPGDWKVKINYSENTYAIVDFTIVENEFSDDLKLKDEIIAYDGKSHGLSLVGPLPEGTNVYFPYGNSFSLYSQNPYQVKCIVSKDGYKAKELNGTLTITKSEYDKKLLEAIEFKDAEYVYDGLEKKIVATNIPEDCTIEYFIGTSQGNACTNVGVYEITGVLTCSNPNYYELPNISATLTIKKATYDISGVTFEDKVEPYEKGVQHSILIGNSDLLPSGVKVTYDNNVQEDAGEYEAIAYFEGDSNHEAIAPMKAKLTITKQNIDLSSIKFVGAQTVYFNNEIQDFHVEVPKGIKVIRKYFDKKGVELPGSPSAVGVYTVKVTFGLDDSFKEGNYNLINVPKVEGVLYIQKKVLDLTEFDFTSQTYTYDGNVHEFDIETKTEDGITNKLPEEIIVNKTYVFNGQELVLEKPKEVGTYIVNFDVKLKEGLLADNYDVRGIPTETGRLIIVKKVIDLIDVQLEDQTVIYNEEAQEYVLEGVPTDCVNTRIVYHDPSGAEITPDKVKDAGDYRVHVYFSLNEEGGYDSDHYELINAKVRQPFLHILRYRVDFTDIVPLDVTAKATPSGYVYDPSNIKNFLTVSDYVDLECVYYKRVGNTFVQIPLGEYPTEAGKYQVKVGFKLKTGKDPKNFELYNKSDYTVNLTLEE